MVNLLTFVYVLATRFRIRFDTTRVRDFPTAPNQFINLYPVAWQLGFSGYVNAFNMLLSYIKTLKYLGQIKNLAILLRTLQVTAFQLLGAAFQ